MSFRVVKRTEIGLPEMVTSTNGSPRPPISNCDYYTAHYTGVYVKYGDPGDTPAEILNLENVARQSGKPNEYNYVIGTDEDNLIYEYAGAFRAAHSAGENQEAIGVLFFNGVEEPLTDLQVQKFRWLRDEVLVPFKVLAPNFENRPHKDMPGAATACPGTYVLNRWDELIKPWDEVVVPPNPNPPSTPEVFHVLKAGETIWGIARELYTTDAPVGVIADAIMQANNINESTVLHPGAVIALPGLMKLV